MPQVRFTPKPLASQPPTVRFKPIVADPNQAIKDRQAAQFQTSAEMGGKSGSMVQPRIDMTDPRRTAGQVALDQMSRVGPGALSALTGIPGALMGTGAAIGQIVTGGGSSKGQEMLRGMVQPLVPVLRGADVGPFLPRGTQSFTKGINPNLTPPESPEWPEAAGAAGAMLGGSIMEPVAAGGMAALKRIPIPKSAALSSKYAQDAAVNTAKSLRPVSLEDKAITLKLAPEMSRRGIRGLTGKGIDKKLVSGLDASTEHLSKVEARLSADPRPEMQIQRQPLIDKVDTAISKLKVKGTGKAVNPQAVAALEEVKALFESLPEYADFDQVLDLRRKLDSAVDDAGGFRQSTTAADRVTMKARRGGADIVRGALNELDPALKKANQDFSFHRHLVDVTQRRQLGEVGQTGSGLPGRGSLLDDLLATWAGDAIGGPVGAAAIEGVNLARQTRGYASAKGAVQQKIADVLRPPVSQRLMLNAGNPMLSMPASSSVTGTTAPVAPATREIRTGRLLNAGLPLPPGTELPSGGFKMDVTTGRPAVRGTVHPNEQAGGITPGPLTDVPYIPGQRGVPMEGIGGAAIEHTPYVPGQRGVPISGGTPGPAIDVPYRPGWGNAPPNLLDTQGGIGPTTLADVPVSRRPFRGGVVHPDEGLSTGVPGSQPPPAAPPPVPTPTTPVTPRPANMGQLKMEPGIEVKGGPGPVRLGANETEAATIAARGRPIEQLKPGKIFDEQGAVNSPLFQGRGGKQGFLGVDERAAVVDNAVDTRLQQFAAENKSGDTALTGKSQVLPDKMNLNFGMAEARRFKGGTFKMFPELASLGESPAALAKAIIKDKDNPTFLRAKKAVTPVIEEAVQEADAGSFDFGANVAPAAAPVRGRAAKQNLTSMLSELGPGGADVTMRRLREKFGGDQAAMENAVREAIDKGDVYVQYHDHGEALSAAERAERGLVDGGIVTNPRSGGGDSGSRREWIVAISEREPGTIAPRGTPKAPEAPKTPSDPGHVVKDGPYKGYVFEGVTKSDTGRQVFVYRKPGVEKPYLPNTRIKS